MFDWVLNTPLLTTIFSLEKKSEWKDKVFGHSKFSDSRKSGASLDKIYRCSHRRCSVRKGVLRNSSKFTGNHLKPETLLKETLVQVFSSEFCEISKNTSLQLVLQLRAKWTRLFEINLISLLQFNLTV